MVRSAPPLVLVLASVLIAAAMPASRADDPSAPPGPVDSPSPKADGTSTFSIPGEEPVQRFIPLRPRTVEDRRLVEALRDYSTARALEAHREWSESIALLEQALKIEPDSIAILRRLSRLCFALGRTESAVEYSRRVIAADPGDSEMISRLVAYYLKKKDPAGAQAMLQEVLDNPKLGKDEAGRLLAEFELGKLYAGRLQQIDKAADAFTLVVEALDDKAANRLSPADQRRILGGDEAGAYLDFGLLFLAAKRYDQAIKAFERGLVYNPDHPQLSLQLAQTLEKTGKGDEALAVVERYLKRQPQGVEGYELLAKVLTALKRQGEITPRLERAAKVDSNNVALQYALADRYRETGQVEKAEALYKTLLASQPTPQGYGALAASLLKRKKTDELLRVITEAVTKPGGVDVVRPQLDAIAADPAYAEQVLEAGHRMLSATPPTLDTPAIDVLAYIATRSKKLEKLVPIQRLALKQNPSPLAYQGIANTLLQMGKYDEAAATIEELMDKFPDEKNPRHFLLLGKLRRAAHQEAPALEAVRQALKLDPTDVDAQTTLCLLLAQTGKIDEAIEVAKTSLKDDPANPDFNRILGGILTQSGKEDEAFALYKSLLDRFPNNEAVVRIARSGLSVIYVNRGEIAKGEAELEALLEREPDDAGVNNDLGYLYADQGKNLDKAEAMIRKALAEEPDNYAYLDSLGWVLFKRGKAKEAVEPLEKAVKLLSGSDATIHEHLGDVYFQLQLPAKAKSAWEAAEAAGAKATPPDKRLPEIRKKLESLEKLGQAPRPSSGDSP